MLKKLILCSSLISVGFSSAQDYKESQMRLFESQKEKFELYKSSQDNDFESYKASQEKAYNNYKKSLSLIWEKPELSTKETLVTYSKDKKTRTTIDFSTNELKVQTIAPSAKDAKEKLQIALAKAVVMDTKVLQESDPLEQELAKIKAPKNVAKGKLKTDPILATVLFKKTPTKKDVYAYVTTNAKEKNFKVKKSQKVNFNNVYTLNVALPQDTMLKRSKIYYTDVRRESLKQEIPIPLIFAIMHSESSFNPMARSHIPAYGLMQIVPKSAGIDAYYHLYREKKLVSGRYLYNSQNNIKMGSAYLHILYYKYLKHIKNQQSRLYCTIAAYNTGAGNVARAFVKSNSVVSAAKVINRMSPEQVYAKLLKDLKYDEPKHYLKKVNGRMSSYAKVYRD